MKFKSDIEVQAGMKDSSGAIGASGQVLSSTGSNVSWVNQTTVANDVQNRVKAGVAINKGQAVYVTGADGTNIIVGLASNATEATSSKTLGLLNATVAINGMADVVQIGRLSGLNTLGAVAGDPVWLGTGGNLIYGLINKPYAPANLVFIGVVTRVNVSNGEIFVSVQNGFELKEIHDVDLITNVPINGDVLGYDGTLWVNKTIAQWLGFTPANASGTTNYVSKFTGTTTLGNSQIYDNGTNVGIGTTSPIGKLEVYSGNSGGLGGSIVINNNGLAVNSSTALMFGDGNSTGIRAAISTTTENSPYYGKMEFKTGAGLYSSLFTRMTLTGSGSLLLGDTVQPSAPWRGTAVFGINGASKVIIGNLNSSYTGATIGGHSSALDAWDDLNIVGGNVIFRVNETEKMRLTTSGNVGIGTSTPSGKLDVYGDGYFGKQDYSYQAIQKVLTLRGDPISGLYAQNSYRFYTTPGALNSAQKLSIRAEYAGSESSDLMTILGNGNVGIGISNPSEKITVLSSGAGVSAARFTDGNYADMVLSFPSLGVSSIDSYQGIGDGTLAFRTATNERMRITSSGNVGIGTTSPSQKLEVSGTALINGVLNSYATMDNLARRFNSPEGGSYITSSSSVTGAIKIKLPIARNNSATMMMFTVKIYQYSTGLAQEFQIAGYNYSAGGWYNPSVTNLSDSANNFIVRFGADATSDCVWIGETSSTWIYPQVFVTDFQAGYNGQSIDWATGWNVSFQTSFDTVELSRVASQVLTTNNISSFGITGSGTTNYVPKFTGATSLGNSLIYDNGSGVGIGTTTPSSKLNVSGDIHIGDYGSAASRVLDFRTNNSVFTIQTDGTSGGLGTTIAYSWANGGQGPLKFNNAAGEVMRLSSSGNVGIGTTSPQVKLHVISNSSESLRLQTNSDYNYFTFFNSVGSQIGDIGYDGRDTNILSIWNNSSGGVLFGANGAERMRITSTGNVGIGTSTPTAAKLVLNSGTTNQNALINGDKIGFTRTSDAAEVVYFKKDISLGTEGTANINGYDGIQFRTQGAETVKAVITSSGNVGIGTTSPSYKLQVDSGTNIASFRSIGSGENNKQIVLRSGGDRSIIEASNASDSTDAALAFNTASNERMRITSTGDVAIGTTAALLNTSGRGNVTINGSSESILTLAVGGVWKTYLFNNGTDSYLASFGALIFGTNNAEQMRITSSGNLGIGTSMPSAKLDVVDTMTNPTLRLAYVPSSGYGGGGNIDFVGGYFDYVSGAISWKNGTTVQGQVDYTGVNRMMTLTSQSTITFRTSLMERMRIDSTGQVGIGTSAPMYTLHVNGSVAGTSAYINLSDERYKKDILPIENALDKVLSLNGVTFNWNKEFNPETNLDDANHIGLIAQEVEKVIPQAVSTASDDNQTKSVAYSDLVPVLIEAIKELKLEIEELKKLINK